MKNLLIIALITVAIAAHSGPAQAGDNLERTADVLQFLIPAAAGGVALVRGDREGRIEFLESFSTTAAATYGLKEVVDEKRPNGGGHAFPSGHASLSFVGAAFLHRRYGLMQSLPAYAAAVFVGWASVETDRHGLADVMAGAALGMGSAFFFTSPREKMQVAPLLAPQTYGMQFRLNW